MQDYRRKIAYLYAYEGGEKLGNAGFVKAEDRGGDLPDGSTSEML